MKTLNMLTDCLLVVFVLYCSFTLEAQDKHIKQLETRVNQLEQDYINTSTDNYQLNELILTRDKQLLDAVGNLHKRLNGIEKRFVPMVPNYPTYKEASR